MKYVRRLKQLGVVAALCALPRLVHAEEFKAGKNRVILTLDLFLPGNAGDGLRDETQSGMQALSGLGYSTTGSVTTDPAIGGSLGVLVPLTEAFDLGVIGATSPAPIRRPPSPRSAEDGPAILSTTARSRWPDSSSSPPSTCR